MIPLYFCTHVLLHPPFDAPLLRHPPHTIAPVFAVNGYEGTGRSLSLKLIAQLRDQAQQSAAAGASGRTFREVKLSHPIRYAPGDNIEAWLHELLCLNAADHVPRAPPRLPHPDECSLFCVERDTLFSYHKASEELLQRMMALYVSSHYRNTPNDLLLMADAPSHRLFVLLGPVDETSNDMPDVLCVMQVALEGMVSRDAARAALASGKLPQGDMIPWVMGQQFQVTVWQGCDFVGHGTAVPGDGLAGCDFVGHGEAVSGDAPGGNVVS